MPRIPSHAHPGWLSVRWRAQSSQPQSRVQSRPLPRHSQRGRRTWKSLDVRRLQHMSKSAQPPAEYFDPSYFQWQAERSVASARVVVPALIDLFNPASVLDVGCGTGAWLQAFIENVVSDVVGVDGDYVARADLRIDEERFVPADLEALPPLQRRFDLAISLEAAHY